MSTFVHIPKNSDFPLENLPYGVFSTLSNPRQRVCVAIGEHVLDLSGVAHLYPLEVQAALKATVLNELMALDHVFWPIVRNRTRELLTKGSELDNNAALKQNVIIAQKDCKMHVPANIGDYTDFYSSIHHATNVGIMFRGKDNALMPNWRYIPVGYHGRASSIVVSGTPIHRPMGQTLPVDDQPPVFGPCKLFDFELEMACFVGGSNALGERITAENAWKHVFGFSLMNDWSARDIQKWEYIPLGPFTSKNLGTTLSPWIVTVDALTPYIVDNFPQDPPVFPYLYHERPFNFDINLEVSLKPQNSEENVVSRSNYKYLYWTALQQIAHNTVTGCNLRPGDVVASGTISGETEDSYGSMLELSWRGSRSIQLQYPAGATRKFLQDGDEVIIRGHCERNGVRIGFGECAGVVLPAKQ